MESPYEKFPQIAGEQVTLRKIVDADLGRLFERDGNEKLFLYSPVTLRKNREAVRNRDGHLKGSFLKKKGIFLGNPLKRPPRM